MDLANEIIRETYRGNKSHLPRLTNREPSELRWAIATAKRFVLDDPMSEFMGELATVPFCVAPERQADILSSLRHSAIVPFPKMFVQFNNRAFRNGLVRANDDKRDFWGQSLLPSDSVEITRDIGWLIEQDIKDSNLIWITEFTSDELLDESMQHRQHGPKSKSLGEIFAVPLRFAYRTDEQAFFPEEVDLDLAIFAHGLVNGPCENQPIGIHILEAFRNMDKKKMVEVRSATTGKTMLLPLIVPEFGGVVRYVLCFLATLNNIPKVETVVRPQKGFLGGGQIRKYMDYTNLTLKLPERTTSTRLAKRLIANVRLGWHEVRPHWRILKDGVCSFHIWTERDLTGHSYCKECSARRVWIVLPHGRGDPTISIRTHKYIVTHPRE